MNSGTLLEGETPRHGFQGDRNRPTVVRGPACMTIALSREAGARGNSIAVRLGKRLGWQVYTQELLEFMAMNDGAQQQLFAELPPDAAMWAERQMDRLRLDQVVRSESELGELPHLMLMLASRGEVVIVGRGAGYLLPSESTLHVRIVSPLPERIAYMGQWLRLTREQAAEEVRKRDQRRAEYLASSFRRPPAEPHAFDLVLNSSRLGEEVCADLIIQAMKSKEAARPDVDHGQ